MEEKSLREMQQVDIKNVNTDELVDISEIEIYTKQSVGYSDCTETLNDRLKQYISKIAETKY